MNIYYIRAAIQAATNVKLTIEQTKQYLIEEGLVTRRDADKLVFVGYKDYYSYTPSPEVDTEELSDIVEGVIDPLDDDAVVSLHVALNDVI